MPTSMLASCITRCLPPNHMLVGEIVVYMEGLTGSLVCGLKSHEEETV